MTGVRHAGVAIAVLALAGCVTAPRGESGWSFPPAFTASQVVEVQSPRGTQTLLASLWRGPQWIEIAFLDPALQVPLAVARLERGEFSEERMVRFPMEPREVEALLRDVEALYEALGWEPSGDGWTGRVGRWSVEIARPSGPAGCAFPERIAMHPAGTPLPRIEVRTLDVRCGSR